ncbi:hypothetical protein KO465_08655 [Candidatus Micrarchaeota archaeon]|nr:hypothetical protein [Candidatus Micrarchaeota archaeon]
MPPVKKHPVTVPGYKRDMNSLGKDVGKLRYDKLIEFLESLSEEINSQSLSDYAKGRTQVSEGLGVLHDKLDEAKDSAEKVWKKCKPHMKDELED